MTVRTILKVSIAMHVATVLFLAGKRIYYSRRPAAYAYSVSDYMNATAQLQASFPIDTGDIVFVGNSLTANFPLYEIFGPGIKNRGIGSNTTTDILNRIAGIAKCRPRKLFLECGVNDLAEGIPVDTVAGKIDHIIHIIKSAAPGTELYLQSVLPTCKESLPLMPRIDSLNERLKELGYPYIEVHSKLRNGAGLDSAYTWDGIHLNSKGYMVWAEMIRPYTGRK